MAWSRNSHAYGLSLPFCAHRYPRLPVQFGLDKADLSMLRLPVTLVSIDSSRFIRWESTGYVARLGFAHAEQQEQALGCSAIRVDAARLWRSDRREQAQMAS